MVSPLSTGEFSAVPQKLYSKLPEILDVPNLIKVQLDSFRESEVAVASPSNAPTQRVLLDFDGQARR